MKRFKEYVFRASLFFFPWIAAAQTPSAPITTAQGLLNFMCTIFGFMFYGLITLSIIMIVIAGFNYTTAGDNGEKVSKATKMILYASIGVAVALLAKAVPPLVANLLGANGKFLAC
jgi:hypothetical protein